MKLHRKLGQQYYSLCEGWLWWFLFEDSQDLFESVRVISKNDLESQQKQNVQEVQTQPFEIQHKFRAPDEIVLGCRPG